MNETLPSVIRDGPATTPPEAEDLHPPREIGQLPATYAPPREFADELSRHARWIQDPLVEVAQNLRGLTLEQITQMCDEMGRRELRDSLVQWAIAKLEGQPLPLQRERRT